LKDLLGLKTLYIKDEGLNPTASLKDRASVIAVVKALEEGKETIACSSTGNAASSLAGNAAHVGLKTVIFVPDRAPIGKLTQLLIYGAKVVSVLGDYGETFQLSKAAIDQYGWYNRNAAINPALVEGKKTVILEVMEQLNFEVPDWVVVSVGDGCTIGGVYKGLYDLLSLGFIKKMPKILGVQAEGCAPIYKAFVEGSEVLPTPENTLADSISVGIPRNPVKALDAVTLTHGSYITVTDQEILEAIGLLGKMEGIFGEPAGVAGTAGLKKALEKGYIGEDETVVVIMTGNGLKDVANGLKAAPEPIKIKPDLSLFKQYFE
jgi:threonine synthase